MKTKSRNKTILITSLIFLGLCLSAIVYLEVTTQPNISPEIKVWNLQICRPEDDKWVFLDAFSADDLNYICAEMETNESSVRLTLIIQPADNLWVSKYQTAKEFESGFIFYPITENLDSGRYLARIMYARKTLADVYFDIDTE